MFCSRVFHKGSQSSIGTRWIEDPPGPQSSIGGPSEKNLSGVKWTAAKNWKFLAAASCWFCLSYDSRGGPWWKCYNALSVLSTNLLYFARCFLIINFLKNLERTNSSIKPGQVCFSKISFYIESEKSAFPVDKFAKRAFFWDDFGNNE